MGNDLMPGVISPWRPTTTEESARTHAEIIYRLNKLHIQESAHDGFMTTHVVIIYSLNVDNVPL